MGRDPALLPAGYADLARWVPGIAFGIVGICVSGHPVG